MTLAAKFTLRIYFLNTISVVTYNLQTVKGLATRTGGRIKEKLICDRRIRDSQKRRGVSEIKQQKYYSKKELKSRQTGGMGFIINTKKKVRGRAHVRKN